MPQGCNHSNVASTSNETVSFHSETDLHATQYRSLFAHNSPTRTHGRHFSHYRTCSLYNTHKSNTCMNTYCILSFRFMCLQDSSALHPLNSDVNYSQQNPSLGTNQSWSSLSLLTPLQHRAPNICITQLMVLNSQVPYIWSLLRT